MFDKSGKPGSKGPAPSEPKKRRSRVNIARRFTLLAQTGQGSMSKVYRAIDKPNGRTVCLKVQLVEKNAAALARASRDGVRPDEGETALQIVHPHVVRTYECGDTSQGEHFIVMEFVDGASFQLVRESHSADLARKIDLLTQAAEGLAAVHAAGFIHHDVNPRNFLVNREGQVKLIDFGLAIPNTPAFCRPGNRTGTIQYMAPELIRREAKDVRLDIFAFGAMAFEFLADKLPYDTGGADTNSLAAIMQKINQDPLDPEVANPLLHPALCAVIRKAIARKRQDRYASMRDLIADLEALPPEARILRRPGQIGSSSGIVPSPVVALEETQRSGPSPAPNAAPAGGVLLLRSGLLYMILKTNNRDRRIEQIRQSVQSVEILDVLPAIDPAASASEWQKRFEGKRQKGDWFALTDADLAEFAAAAAMVPW